MIGDPEQRYREDPVRMLRAVRFSASRGLEIEQTTREPIKSVTHCSQRSAARLSTNAQAASVGPRVRMCDGSAPRGSHHVCCRARVILEQPMGERFVMMSLRNTDARIKSDKPVSPSFLFASLLWHEVLATWRR